MANALTRIIGAAFYKVSQAMGVSFGTMDANAIRRVFGSPTNSGKNVDENSAMSLAVCWACQRILAEATSSIPWALYRKDGKGGSVQDDTHPLAIVLRESPNKDMTSVEFREALTMNLAQAGNAYSWKETLADQVVSLTPFESKNVQPKRYGPGVHTKLNLAYGDVFYSILNRGQWEDFPREKIWHVKGFGNNGFVGLSPLGAAREALGLALATDEFGARFFSQGGLPSGIVTVDGWLSAEQRTIARENLQQLMGGLQAAHKFALFEGKMKPEPWGQMNLEELQFLMLRKFSVQEICRFYRIPPHMVADFERGSSYNSIEQMSQEFVTFTLMPYFTRYESSASRWLLPLKDRGTYFLRFNASAFLRGDSEARKDYYSSALQNGWLNRNEVRGLEDMNRVEAAGMDDYTAQTNLAPVDKLGALAEAAAKKTPAPVSAPPGGKAQDVTIHSSPTIVMPSELEHKVRHDMVVPSMTALADAVKDLLRNQDSRALQLTADNRDLLRAFLEGSEKAYTQMSDMLKEFRVQSDRLATEQAGMMQTLVKIANQKRKLLVDGEGNPIGTAPAEELRIG